MATHNCNICNEPIDGLENQARFRNKQVYLYFHIPCIAADKNYNDFVDQGRSRKIEPDEKGPIEIEVAKLKKPRPLKQQIPNNRAGRRLRKRNR